MITTQKHNHSIPDDAIDFGLYILGYLTVYKRLPRDGFTTHYQGFDSREREELHRCDLILYELISLKQDKTREDNLKLVSIALKCLRDSVTEREKRWWVRELEHHLKNLKGGDSSD